MENSTFWRLVRSRAWSKSREHFAWTYPVGSGIAVFITEGLLLGWERAMSDTVALLVTGAVASATAVALYCVNTIRAGNEIHGENLSNINAIDSDKQAAIRERDRVHKELLEITLERDNIRTALKALDDRCSGYKTETETLQNELAQLKATPIDWRSHEQRFERLKGSVYALWTYDTENGDVVWHSYRAPDTGTTLRDEQAFEAEATAAASDLKKLTDPPQTFTLRDDAPAIHVWLNALHALVDSKSDFDTTGLSEGRRTVGGSIDDLVEASKVACARLAAGDLSRPKEIARNRCRHLSAFVEEMHAAMNAAIDDRYSEKERQRLERLTHHIADWISYRLGPAKRRVFLFGEPRKGVYTKVPPQFMDAWQVSMGQWTRLQEFTKHWCDEVERLKG